MRRAVLLILCTVITGCDADRDMKLQPVARRHRPDPLHPDRPAAQPAPPGTVARQREAEPAQPFTELAIKAQLLRGQDRFDVFCAVCHGRDGYGQGPVVRRGFPAPPSLHDDAIRSLTDQHYLNVISHGLGKMPPYAAQIPPADRQAIISYLRALQLSQHADTRQLPPDEQARIPNRESAAP